MNSAAEESLAASLMDNMLSISDTMSWGSITMSGSWGEIRKLFFDARPSITNSRVVLAPVMVLGGLSL